MISYSTDITFSPRAALLMKANGVPPELAQEMAVVLDDVNEDTLNVIRQRLNVAGNSQRGKKETQQGWYLYPHKITSRLQNSMSRTRSVIERNGNSISINSIIGSGVSGNKESVSYAYIQEHGGFVTIPSRARVSKNKKYLESHSPETKGYTIEIKARSYLRTTLSERLQVYSRRLSRAVKQFFDRQ